MGAQYAGLRPSKYVVVLFRVIVQLQSLSGEGRGHRTYSMYVQYSTDYLPRFYLAGQGHHTVLYFTVTSNLL